MEFFLKARSCLRFSHLLWVWLGIRSKFIHMKGFQSWSTRYWESIVFSGILRVTSRLLQSWMVSTMFFLLHCLIEINSIRKMFTTASPWQLLSIMFHGNYTHPQHANCSPSSHYFSVGFWIQMPHPNHLSLSITQFVLASLVLRSICWKRCSQPSSLHFISIYYLWLCSFIHWVPL